MLNQKSHGSFFVQMMFLFKKGDFCVPCMLIFRGVIFSFKIFVFGAFSKLHHDTCFSPPMTLKVGSLAKVDVFWGGFDPKES